MFEGFKSLWISLSIQFSIQWKDQIRWYVIIRWYAFVYVIWQTCLSQFLKLLFYCVGSVSGTHCPLIQLFTLRHFLQKYQTMFGYLPILKFLSLPHCKWLACLLYPKGFRSSWTQCTYDKPAISMCLLLQFMNSKVLNAFREAGEYRRQVKNCHKIVKNVNIL